MARTRTVDLLPEIFRTDTNKQFLAATLDQLTQEPKFKKTQGFIGRRVGPGVDPNDKYVVEPSKTRQDYQLEPGVVNLKPDTNTINNVITYPGINDAIGYQGGDQTRPDRLYESQYYTWDPFIDYDAFVNFSQYFWLPNGPDAVDVAATGVPTSDNFVVTRENGVYTFSGLAGEDPTINLVRGGNYTFQVAQNNKETVNFRVQNDNISAYIIDYQPNPELTLVRGNTYVFNIVTNGVFPFWIKYQQSTGTGYAYSTGVTRNGSATGLITFTVPQDAPDTLYYASENQLSMTGVIKIVDAQPGTGPGFWIQTAPGISGKNPVSPNLSTREVLGVTNNGQDLGTVTFDVPLKTAQDYYYNLTSFGTVDLITDLQFDQINNQPLDQFLKTYGGIDGITNLNTRTLIFTNPISNAQDGGWLRTTLFDPLPENPAYNALPGSYDNLLFDQTDEIPVDDRYQLWQISYVSYNNVTYLQLNKLSNIPDLEKFSINYGTEYSTTQWYKNSTGVFTRIPYLTAVLDTLYYQDGTDPGIVGQIRLLDQSQNSTLFIDSIIGKKNYTSPNGVAFTNGLKVIFRGDVVPASYANTEYYVSGVGVAIELLPVSNFICPELYVVDANDSTQVVEPAELDYLTISRASKDLNAWSRSNRWFHIDVINATAQYNNTQVIIDNNARAKRPVIQFRPGIRLFDMGTQGKQPVNVIDFTQTDAFSNVQGATSYSVDGYNLVQGSRVVFAADQDPNVSDKIWVVSFITPDSNPPIPAPYTGQPIINLTLADDGIVLANNSTVCLSGLTLVGKTFWYDGAQWLQAQQKTSIQQTPLFDVYDSNGISFSNQTTYPSSNFVGSKLFSYASPSSGVVDVVLKFPLQYLNINNVGDIVFDNNLYKDTFVYTRDNVSVTENISSGFVREYADRTIYQRQIGWQTAVTPSLIRQQFRFTYNGGTLKLDVKVATDYPVPAVKIYVGSQFRDPGTYTYVTTDTTTTITLDNTYAFGDIVEVEVLSAQTSQQAFYQVPINLEKNPLNGNSDYFTLGTVRSHYESICQNLTTLSGKINGPNNTRDLGNIGPYGLIILQQSAPLTLAGYFLRSQDNNIFAAVDYNGREYLKFKNQMLNAVTQQTIQFQSTADVLDEAIASITLGKIETQPFYWSDMIPQGALYTTTTYNITFVTTNTFDTVYVHNYKSANYLGMNVYLNDVILTRGTDYTVSTDGPRITILRTLEVGEVISIREYSSTVGSFVPNTPSKMGLYPAWRPQIVTEKSTTGTVQGIVGHDGSFTPLFGDIRDDVLLEYETRIYNNIKLDGNPVPLELVDVLPGAFRKTGFTIDEINTILSTEFLNYVGNNKLDYRTQDFSLTNEFSWNYEASTSKIEGVTLPGAWRGINRYFYDTQQPEEAPWEMLGFTDRPAYWNDAYGPGPYTDTNLVLWDDLAAGLVADPVAPYVRPAYVRPGLTNVIPTGTQGELQSPVHNVVGDLNTQQIKKDWQVGDGGPVEASWWNSSAYPFAIMWLLAVTRPAKFFALFADRDLYKYNAEFDQYLYNERYRLDANGVEVYGNGVSKASYINWIVDYNRVTGLDSTTLIQADLKNLDVRLCYRMASFSDKQYIKIYTEKSSPNSQNTTFLIPDESYNLLLYKNQPFDHMGYSSVIVKQVSGGYSVFGYSTTQSYFDILLPQPNGQFITISAGGVAVQVPKLFTNTVGRVPYGHIFTSQSSVVEFLLGYGKYLESQGMTFTDRFNGYDLDWQQMAREFLYWSNQGWNNDALINLNPLANRLTITKPDAVVDNIFTQTQENLVVDQNRKQLDTRNLNIVRLENTFSIQALNGQSINSVDLKFTSYEHIIVLNNQSAFGDLIYEPITGARQSRLNLVAATTTDWNGSLDAQGFILNRDNVPEWTGLKTYAKGELVKYKNQYWSAATIVQPSAKFNFNDWYQSEYTQIELGLLPNLANKANQLSNSYNINTANLESDNDLLAYGLIGFRPRQYMAALNLDDVSQVNIYRQFIKSKGTLLSAELFGQANLGKESADYQIYENWAVQRGVYGANANRSFFELRLNRSLLSSNPSVVQVIVPNQSSEADQTILLGDVWRESYKLTSTNILPTTTEVPLDVGLPTAGYVNLNDADITVFDIQNNASLKANIDKIKVGTSIWTAKINDYDWGIYRAESVPGIIQHVCDNLNGTSRVIFSTVHGLTTGDKLIIKFFDSEVDGVYDVVSVANINTVNIVFKFTGSRTVADGNGLGFTLKTMRVSQASNVGELPYALAIQPGAKVWVDDNGQGLWEVLQKQYVFSSTTQLAPVRLDAGEQYGSAVAQADNRIASLVGSPRYGFATGTQTGAVYLYVKSYSDQYIPVSPVSTGDGILTLGTTGVRGYGNAVDFGSQTWAVAGASASLGPASQPNYGYACVIYRDPTLGAAGEIPYAQWQLLTADDGSGNLAAEAGEFGYSVAMSNDERWLYVGAPGANKVYAYGREVWQNQFVNVLSDGVTKTYAFGQTIQINANTQLRVYENGKLLTLGVDYTVSNFNTVNLATAPAVGTLISIQRTNSQYVNGDGVTTNFNVGQYFFTATNIYSVNVFVNNVLQRPNIDYTWSGPGTVVFTVAPASGTNNVEFVAQSYFKYVSTLTVAGLNADARFGQSLAVSTDGQQVVVGAPKATVSGKVEAGAIYVFDRDVQRFIYGQDPSSVTFTVLGTVTTPVSVTVNNEFLINQTDSVINAPNSYTVSGNNVTVLTDLIVGDVVEVQTNQFKLFQTVYENTVAEFSNFGTAVDLCKYNCSLYGGAPQSSAQIFKGGVVERSVNVARIYGSVTAGVANPSLTAGDTLRVNNMDVAVPMAPNNTVAGLASAINAMVPNVIASVDTTGYLTIAVKNSTSAPVGNKLSVKPGSVGTVWTTCAFAPFVFTQQIQNPYPLEMAAFGQSLSLADSATSLVVGANNGTQYIQIVWDDDTTIWDIGATIFFSDYPQSGAVYTFDLLNSSTNTQSNPSMFVFGDQIVGNNIASYDNYGIALSYKGDVLLVGAPGNDAGDSAANYGRVYVFENASRKPAWIPVAVEQPVVDIRLLSSVFFYDRITSARTEFLDFFNPLQGKILGAARQNIDYITAVDPASYNNGPVNNIGTTWFGPHVGEVWWDISSVRFIDPSQDSVVYASRRWGQIFPGSTIKIYQWIESSTPPANYAGPGTPLDAVSYTVNTSLNQDGTLATNYYFWVSGLTTVAVNQGKTLPISTVASYIADPKSSGIPYLAPINASTVAVYNSGDLIQAQDTILHIEFDRVYTTSNIHIEYELIPENRADGWISQGLYRKLQDSFCGVDTFGNIVPDPNLNVAERYGVQFRPRQSMFVDRFVALKNYLTRVNSVLALYPVVETKTFVLLNSKEPVPSSSSGTWDFEVPNLEILGYQDIYAVPLGYTYLVLSDSSNNGLWTIYTVQESLTQSGARDLALTRVQNYNTPAYWSYINWYLPGYNPSTKVVTEVPNYSALAGLTQPVGSSVKVTANAQGKWEIYIRTLIGWDRVALQDGTIEFSAKLWDYALGRFGFDVEVFDAQYFDQEPVIETRKIIQAINEELFVGDLLIERNRALILMFNFVLSEFSAPEWLVKTSLIDVNHTIRDLAPYQNYRRDNQEFVLDYIKEVKPYHVSIREFNLIYNGSDMYAGSLTDFDLPAYYNTSLDVPAYTSPVLLPYEHSSYQPFNILSDVYSDNPIWTNWPYSQWLANYTLSLESVVMIDQGTGYTVAPTVIVQGTATVPAQVVPVLNYAGQIIGINVINPGSGYTSTPTIVFDGGNGTGARAYATMINGLTRSFKTIIKYDRFQYQTTIVTWNPDGTYTNGTLVRYLDQVWRAQNSDGSSANVGPDFNLQDWVPVPAGELTGVDRTMGYYVPSASLPGLELPLLIDGVDYPGVQVWGNYYGLPLPPDADYESSYTDIALGTRFSDINVEGGQYIGPYEGHAPEELVNGAEYDTLDLRVFTRPGSDWSLYDGLPGEDGHGFKVSSRRYTLSAASSTYSWQGIVEFPTQVLVSNITTGLDLIPNVNFTIDWDAETITILSGVAVGESFNIFVYEMGGGSQLYRELLLGAVGTTIYIPVDAAQIHELVIFKDGAPTTGNTFVAWEDNVAWNILNSYNKFDVVTDSGNYYRALQDVPGGTAIFNTTYWLPFVPTLQTKVTLGFTPAPTDGISLTALGYTTPVQFSWSTPVVQYVTADSQIASTRTITLTNSMQGTNPVNVCVVQNGSRVKPPGSIEWIGDDSSVQFGLPQRLGFSQSLIYAPTDILVWVDNVLQVQTVGGTVGTYSVSSYTGTETPGRQVIFTTPPASGARILIAVTTLAGWQIVNNKLFLTGIVNINDQFAITSWNDTAQQNLLTQVFYGPVYTGSTIVEGYDQTVYDLATVNDTAGSYDYSLGITIPSNSFGLLRNEAANRLWVTLDGKRLFEGVDFKVQNQELILSQGTIGPTQTLVVTEFAETVVPEPAGFRIFQDMRGVQATYRITPETTTQLVADLSAEATMAYVADVARLSQPNLANNIYGVMTIDGERIMYRELDYVNNIVLGLRRGTAGTAAAAHTSGTDVYDMGRDNLLSTTYQDHIIQDTAYGDGSTSTFYAPSITNVTFDDSSSIFAEAIEVYVGGVKQYNVSNTAVTCQNPYFVTDFDPVAVEFITAPASGLEVTVLVRQGKWWYSTATQAERVQSLQENPGLAARFLTNR